jgi:hypothetical protein
LNDGGHAFADLLNGEPVMRVNLRVTEIFETALGNDHIALSPRHHVEHQFGSASAA